MIHPLQTVDVGAVDNFVKFPMNGRAETATVNIKNNSTAATTAVLTPKWTNDINGAAPFAAFASAEVSDTTVGPGADGISRIDMAGKGWLILQVTTAESGEFMDVQVCDDL